MVCGKRTQPKRPYRNKKRYVRRCRLRLASPSTRRAGARRNGTDAADYDGRAAEHHSETSPMNDGLYSNEGKAVHRRSANVEDSARASTLRLTFACFFFDFDLDGALDIFAANGHVADDIATVQPTITYAQPPLLFRNLGRKKFEDVSIRVGEAFARPAVARGAAYGDYDGDSDLDLIVTPILPRPALRNDGTANHKLRVTLTGAASNRDGIGAKVGYSAGRQPISPL